jgi:hypothetical protein
MATVSATSWEGVYEALTSTDVSVQTVIQERRGLLYNPELTGVWPERLLHVDTMTSIRRAARQKYLGIRRPPFTVLSYKWGLWVVKDGPRLSITDVQWEIPAIDPKHFTTAELVNVIQRLALDTDFVWIDVACIDQFIEETTMREILSEPRMFRQALQAFAWIVDFESSFLEKMLNQISAAADALLDASLEPDDENDLRLIPPVLEEVFKPISTLLNDSPWFRSNWTMREIMLCTQIIILNREGKTVPVHHKKGSPAVIDSIATLCAIMLAWLQRMQRQTPALFHNCFSQGPPAESLHGGANIPETTIVLIKDCLRLVNMNGAFFLYSSRPKVLHDCTTQLLTTGVLLVNGKAGDDAHSFGVQCHQTYHSWGADFKIPCFCSRLCGCPIGKETKCMPCVLEISYRVGDTVVDPRTWFNKGQGSQ